MPGDNLAEESKYGPNLLNTEILCRFWFSEEEHIQYRKDFPSSVPNHQGGWLLLYEYNTKVSQSTHIKYNNVLRIWLSGACSRFEDQTAEVEERRTESGWFYLHGNHGCAHRKVAPVNRTNRFVCPICNVDFGCALTMTSVPKAKKEFV